MNQFIGTFGVGHKLSNKYQRIYADDYTSAYNKMIKKHGAEFSSIYTNEEFHRQKQQGFFKSLKPLPEIGRGFV